MMDGQIISDTLSLPVRYSFNNCKCLYAKRSQCKMDYAGVYDDSYSYV